ncbi:response regulator transcription factor [Persephonella sp. KM09-Lau-8]|uniref:response regulator transcription factor n=1 Tax=Persephonella sp. KM09-Lau-8 TaxID=1158345 RepID=UPI00049509DE|nr:response regulator transcription factor [Persephonella sp. KM09-Lau-8]
MKILLVEDDPILGESLKEYLEANDIEVHWIQDDREIEYIYNFEQYDVIVLDLILKYKKGEEILRDLRLKGIKNPILILTAKSDIKDKEYCFNLGADDYLTKPFNPKELLLRIKALTKRKHIDEIIKIGDVEINLNSKTIKKAGEEIKISKTAWDLLYYLLKNKGSVVETERILNYVWGDKPVGDEIVRTYIKELRKILPKDAIKTYKGRGYKLD